MPVLSTPLRDQAMIVVSGDAGTSVAVARPSVQDLSVEDEPCVMPAA